MSLRQIPFQHCYHGVLEQAERVILLLVDRVAVMSARPGAIKLDLPVDLPRPRSQETTATPRFAEDKATLWDALRDEVAMSLEYT